jgi:chromosome segregation ATPase
MNAHEESQLNNFKAHRAAVQREIVVASGDLKAILDKKEEAERLYAALLEDIASATEQHEAIVVSVSNQEHKIALRWNKLTEAEEELELSKKEFDTHVQKEMNRISSSEAKANLAVGEAETRLKDLITSIEDKELYTASLNKELDVLEPKVLKLRAEAEEFMTDAVANLRTYEADLSELKKQKALAEVELSSVLKRIAVEVHKIEEPQKALAADFAKLARMKRNIDVYAGRIEREHKKISNKPFII